MSANGFCMVTYGSSTWSTVGTPSAGPADMDTTDKIFGGGYSWTSDAAGEGVSISLTGQAVMQSYAIRVISHCAQADDIRIIIWDDTNSEQAINTANFDFGASSSRTAPGVALFTFELPTIARSGAVANCTAITISIVSTAAGQDIRLHQAELYQNLITNPSLETGAVADPWIPDGWATVALDAGDTEAEATVVHSGSGSIQFNTGAVDSEGIRHDGMSSAIGAFFAFGLYVHGDGSKGLDNITFTSANVANLQSALDDRVRNISGKIASAWQSITQVMRSGHANPRFTLYADSAASAARYVDDIYAIPLDAVSLTVVPASKENSTE